MKIRPSEDIIGARVPDSMVVRRRALSQAVYDNDIALLGEHFRAWRAWSVHVENDVSVAASLSPEAIFSWTCGHSSSVRFETACLAYAYARALFRVRQYALAYEHFGLALEEVMQCRDSMPLGARACGAFRMRCLVRAQRLGICELGLDDGMKMLSGAIWLAGALREYGEFAEAGRKEPLGAGESLVATARASISRSPEFATLAMAWSQNPFWLEMLALSRRPKVGERSVLEGREGVFDWARFTSGKPYAA